MFSTGIWGSITLLFGVVLTWNLDTKFDPLLKSWCKKNLWERAFYAKVMSSKAFVFVIKSLFEKVPKYGNFVEILKYYQK